VDDPALAPQQGGIVKAPGEGTLTVEIEHARRIDVTRISGSKAISGPSIGAGNLNWARRASKDRIISTIDA
jgi:hypothetical protein